MFDIRWICENPEAFDEGLNRRGLAPLASDLFALDTERRAALTEAQEYQTRSNALSKQIGAKKAKGEDALDVIAEVTKDKTAQAEAEATADRLGTSLNELLAGIPNLPAPDVPEGTDESANQEIRSYGTPCQMDFQAKEHNVLGESLGLMDFELAAKLSGARFVVLKGALARLQRALGAFMLDLQTREEGYTEVAPPYLVQDKALFGTGQLPKFADDLFVTTDNHWLIPTAEVPLTNLVREKILAEEDLPLRYAALTPCFRSEAGAAGKDTHGMIRQHQFDKVELVSITHPEKSDSEHERMTMAAEEVLKRLDLPYRVVTLATGDLGFSACKTYDIECWLPGQNLYREISSCSNCGDFQARRMQARFRPKGSDKGTRFVHTLNGSGLAVGRTLIAVMENGQTASGRITIPDALIPYMGGMKEIGPEA